MTTLTDIPKTTKIKLKKVEKANEKKKLKSHKIYLAKKNNINK